MTPTTHRLLSTRVLLICAALAAIHLLLHTMTVPALTALAPLSPPAYGLVAGVHSFSPFLARRITDTPGTASLTSAFAALFVAVTTPAGVVAVIPLLIAGGTVDCCVRGGRGTSKIVERRYVFAALLAAVLLFAVGLIVFSPEHLTPHIMIGALLGRVAGELLVVFGTRVLARALNRAGVGRTNRVPQQEP